jgi:hypothetical protein
LRNIIVLLMDAAAAAAAAAAAIVVVVVVEVMGKLQETETALTPQINGQVKQLRGENEASGPE